MGHLMTSIIHVNIRQQYVNKCSFSANLRTSLLAKCCIW